MEISLGGKTGGEGVKEGRGTEHSNMTYIKYHVYLAISKFISQMVRFIMWVCLELSE